MKHPPKYAPIPIQHIGPLKITGTVLEEELMVPLATLEAPLWPSTNRGALLSRVAPDGIRVAVTDDRMTRSILVEGPDAASIVRVAKALEAERSTLESIVVSTSRFARLQNYHLQMVGNLLYIRLEMSTGDAAGHNMTTKAADAVLKYLLAQYPVLKYVSISGNFCTDKKVSAVNGILGRGKYVIAELLVSEQSCQRYLRSTPEKIVQLHIKKNLIGSIIAGGLRSANAHFANVLLALYLATGQDAANIIEGSQGLVHTEVRAFDLYFSVTLPNVIVGTVGSGKKWPFVQENLAQMGCLMPRPPGENAKRLAAIVGATVLCGEISLLAAQTNLGELVSSHLLLERSPSGRQHV